MAGTRAAGGPKPKAGPARARRRSAGSRKPKTSGGSKAGPRPRRQASPPAPASDTPPTTVYVCRSCVWSEAQRERDGKRQGTFLLEAIQARLEVEPLPAGIGLRAVYCLNGCRNPCNTAFRAPGKHHLRYSRLTPENAAEVLAFARAYHASADGDVADPETPDGMRGKRTVHIPPRPPAS